MATNKKTVGQHEDAYIHVPKSWYRPILILIVFGVLFIVLSQIINYDIVSFLSGILYHLSVGIKQVPNQVFQSLEVCTGIIVASGIICYLTNRKKRFKDAFEYAFAVFAFAVFAVTAVALAEVAVFAAVAVTAVAAFAVAGAAFAVAVAEVAVFAVAAIFEDEDD